VEKPAVSLVGPISIHFTSCSNAMPSGSFSSNHFSAASTFAKDFEVVV
jgi:hypothetical protein